MSLSILLANCSISGDRIGSQGRVIGIKDGDTFEILYHGKPVTVRLAHIDCPERSQPFGKAAKQFASDICFGKDVIITEAGKRDRYGRMIAIVSLSDGSVVNKELVKNGFAWHFTRYSSDTSYARLQRNARQAHLGLWSVASAIPPWEWRKSKHRSSNAKTGP